MLKDIYNAHSKRYLFTLDFNRKNLHIDFIPIYNRFGSHFYGERAFSRCTGLFS